MNMKARSARRRKIIDVYRARDFADANRWDLQFWQKQSPQARLSALIAIRDDIKKVRAGQKRVRKNKGELDRPE